MEEDNGGGGNGGQPKEPEQKPKKKKDKQKSGPRLWPLKAFLLTVLLSAVFNIISSLIMTNAGIAVIIILIVVLVILGVLFDMVGMAVASCEEKPFFSMAARKVKGAKISLKLIKNSDIVGSICSDIIGDICNIISGAASATLVLIITLRSDSLVTGVVSVAVTAVLAAITVGMKAVCKKIAVAKRVEIVSGVGKILSLFSRTK